MTDTHSFRTGARRAALAAAFTAALGSAIACAAQGDPNNLRVSGHVEATEVRLAPEMGGRVLTLDVKEGDRVEAGARILTLDATDVQLAIARARTEQASAEAQLRLTRVSARPSYSFSSIQTLPVASRAVTSSLRYAPFDSTILPSTVTSKELTVVGTTRAVPQWPVPSSVSRSCIAM